MPPATASPRIPAGPGTRATTSPASPATPTTHAETIMSRDRPPTPAYPNPPRLRVTPAGDPRRDRPKPLGVSAAGELIGLRVADARHHVHVQGVTGTGKSTWLAHQVLAEADAGRGVVLLDCQGDLASHVLDRLPAHAGRRLVIIDPAETQAPPAWNVLAPTRHTAGVEAREQAAENVIGTFRKLYTAWWGPRMDEVFRAACLTAARRPTATLLDVVAVLTQPAFRRQLLIEHGEPEGLDGFWNAFDTLTDSQRHQLCGPVLSRLRSVLSRQFARDLLGAPGSTIDLGQILDGGILLARLPKGEIGENTAQLVGSLLLSGLWWAATGRSAQPPEQRLDATVVVDECHNFLHLPIGMDDTLAEARGYRLCLVLAHQHSTQLAPDVRDAVDANARTKILFTVSPTDATRLERHVTPYLDADDLARQPGYHVTARTMHHSHHAPPCTLTTEPLPDPVPGRAEALRDAARRRTGLPVEHRAATRHQQRLATAPGGDAIRHSNQTAISVRHSPSHSPSPSTSRSPSHSERDGERDTPPWPTPQVAPGTEE
ncbi:MAG: type IV secretion system DNA-binding domain-containing protein [Streptosporangiales bacterium]|nr:type IV secretion system DNA-binding domain-containing protein [Streptosporangiales bacterium]